MGARAQSLDALESRLKALPGEISKSDLVGAVRLAEEGRRLSDEKLIQRKQEILAARERLAQGLTSKKGNSFSAGMAEVAANERAFSEAFDASTAEMQGINAALAERIRVELAERAERELGPGKAKQFVAELKALDTDQLIHLIGRLVSRKG